jgi:GNAT superfamily N-acetyltransferase
LDEAVFTGAGLKAVVLSDADVPAFQNLLERCRDYFELVEGHSPGPEAASHELRDRPPGCPLENVLCFGLYDGGDMRGVICSLRDYPGADDWYVGLMLLDPGWRGEGRGAAAYAGFEGWAVARGGKTIRLAVIEANPRAALFWERQGFARPRSFPPQKFGARMHVVIEYEKRLELGGARAM